MTNILALPLIEINVLTGTNENWLDTIEFTDIDGVPLSLDGINFSMKVRKDASDAEVKLSGDTNDGRLSLIGTNDGYLTINIPWDVMDSLDPGLYVGDILAEAEGYRRVCVRMTQIELFHGVTR